MSEKVVQFPPPENLALAERLFRRSQDELNSGNRVLEEELLRESLLLNPNQPSALVNLGAIFQWSDLEEAVKLTRMALELKPDYALAHYNMGNFLSNQGRIAEAIFAYKKAIRLAPSYADAYYNLGLLCEECGLVMEAIKSWKYYLRLDQKSRYASIARLQLESLKDRLVVKT